MYKPGRRAIPGVGPSLPVPGQGGGDARPLGCLARAGRAATPTPGGLRILFYHRVSDDHDELAVTPRRFREQMDYLASEGYSVVDILEAVALLDAGTIPPRAPSASTSTTASSTSPRTRCRCSPSDGFRATVFVATGVTDGTVHVRRGTASSSRRC